MVGSTIFDTKDFTTRLDKEFKWDKAHKKECGWDDHDITVLAEGMLQATQVINKMQLEAHMEKKEYKEVTHAKWLKTEYYNGFKQPIYQCTNCNNEVADAHIAKHKFCLHCGAAMDEVIA